MFCYNCGNQLKDGDLYCEKCGMPVNAMPKEEPSPETEASGTYSYTAVPNPAPAERNLMGLLALIAGVVSFMFGFVPFLTFVPEILAAVFGIVGIVKKQGRGMAIAGLILGTVAFLVTLMMSIFVAIFVVGELAPEFLMFPHF